MQWGSNDGGRRQRFNYRLIYRFDKTVSRYCQLEGGLNGWRMVAIDDTGTDLWTVVGAWEELEVGGGAV